MRQIHDDRRSAPDEAVTAGDRIAASVGSLPFSAVTALLFAWLLPGLVPGWVFYAFILAVAVLGAVAPRLVPALFGNAWDLLWGMLRRW